MKIVSWDLIPGIDAVPRAANVTWFEWDDESWPFHWRWPEFYQSGIRDGLKVRSKWLGKYLPVLSLPAGEVFESILASSFSRELCLQ
jgi:hypothetical protein